MQTDPTPVKDVMSPTRTIWRRAAVATMLLWLVAIAVVIIATPIVPAGEPAPIAPAPGFAGLDPAPSAASGWELVRTGLLRQDALWYVAIATDGYPTSTTTPAAAAFFPGFPLVIAAVALPLGGQAALASQIAALLACIAALAGLQRLADLVGGDALARRVLVVTAIFPTSFFLIAPYSEGMFLAASAWALVHVARGRPLAGAALAGIATLTRPVGVLLAVPIVLGVLKRRTDERPPSARTRMLALGGIAAVGGGLLLHGWWSWDDPLAIVNAQAVWQRTVVPFYTAVYHAARFGLQTLVDGSNPYHLLDLVVFVVTITGLVALARRGEMPLVWHGIVNVLLWTSVVYDGRPLMSTPRFALGIPAVMLGWAVLTENAWVERVWLPVSSILFAVHLVLFTRWWFVF